MANSWITHVKAYAKKNNISYSVALKKAGASYKKGSGSATTKVAKATKVKSTAKGKKAKGKVARPRVRRLRGKPVAREEAMDGEIKRQSRRKK